jgi:hypothetical protein
VKRFCQLCDKFAVPMFSEGTTMAQAKERLRTHLGLGPHEEF